MDGCLHHKTQSGCHLFAFYFYKNLPCLCLAQTGSSKDK
jgi:hypothetical protein